MKPYRYTIIITMIFVSCFSKVATAQTNFFPQKHYVITPISTSPMAINAIFQPSLLHRSTLDFSNVLNISAYNYDDLAIFCKLEVKMEKAAGLPVKFRLGEVNYVEQLEGKPYSIFY